MDMVIANNKSFVVTPALIARWLVVAAFDVALLWLIAQLLRDGNLPLALVLIVVALVLTTTYTVERLHAYRWLSVGISLMIVFVLYPILYTVFVSTTNTSFGHVLTKEQAIENLAREQYVPEGGQHYKWTAYQAEMAVTRSGCKRTTARPIWRESARLSCQPALAQTASARWTTRVSR